MTWFKRVLICFAPPAAKQTTRKSRRQEPAGKAWRKNLCRDIGDIPKFVRDEGLTFETVPHYGKYRSRGWRKLN